MIDTGLKNKVAIVTGANHGIGAATAIALAKEGAKVFVTYYRNWINDLVQVPEAEAAKAQTPGKAYFELIPKPLDSALSALKTWF
jgi:3-oxoacyl-[acyl-carrier protein] reductase